MVLDGGCRLTDEGRHWPDLPAAFLLFDGHSVLQKWRQKVGPNPRLDSLTPSLKAFALESILPWVAEDLLDWGGEEAEVEWRSEK